MSLSPADAGASAGQSYYTVADVAGILKIDVRTVYELLSSGQLRSVRISRGPGRRGTHRIPSDYLAEYEQRLRGGT